MANGVEEFQPGRQIVIPTNSCIGLVRLLMARLGISNDIIVGQL